MYVSVVLVHHVLVPQELHVVVPFGFHVGPFVSTSVLLELVGGWRDVFYVHIHGVESDGPVASLDGDSIDVSAVALHFQGQQVVQLFTDEKVHSELFAGCFKP